MDAKLSPAVRSDLTTFAIVVWIASLVVAMGAVWHYKLTPGPMAETPEKWPIESALARDGHLPTLVMFAHPRCPCTRASLSELRDLMGRFAGRTTAYVVFLEPSGAKRDWSHTDSWRDAESIPGVSVIDDIDGREAARFGATTSGHVVLYDARGKLAFSGGITPARGHAGASAQFEALDALLTAETKTSAYVSAQVTKAPVYGCLIQGERR